MPGTVAADQAMTILRHKDFITMTNSITSPPMGQGPAENIEQTQRFLLALDPDSTATFTFQTFDDSKPARPNTVVRSGPLLDLVGLLVNLNRNKFGVFVTVNRTDGKGRKAENIVGLRSFFIDQDDKTGQLAQPLALPPSIIVQSGGGRHYYWLLRDGEPLDRFSTIQTALAKFYGTDPAVSDLPRVMRLPGFVHHKGEPKPVELIEANPGRRYTIDEIQQAHGIAVGKPETNSIAAEPREYAPADADKIKAGCSYIKHCFDDAETLSEPDWFNALGIIGRCEDGAARAQAMSAPHPEYDEDETQAKLESALEYGPRLCENIAKFWDGCATCPHRGRIKSPIVLGSKPVVNLLTEADAVPIVEAALAALKGEKPDAKPLFQTRTLDAVAALNDERRSQFMVDLKTILSDNRKLRSIVSIQDFKPQVNRAVARRAVAQAKLTQDATVGSDLPCINVDGRALRDVSDEALAALINANQPPKYFLQAGRLVFVTQVRSNNGELLEIHRHNQASLKRALSRIANFDHINREGMYAPPDAVTQDILNNNELISIPQLNGITTVPIIQSDGSIASTAGFDPKSGIYYSPPAGFELPEIPENPTDEDLAAAVRILYEPFRQFPYKSRADWAHVVAYQLTLLLRFLIRGNIPGFAFNANRQAVGKTLHPELGCIIVFGFESAEPIPPTGEDEEMRKKITSELLKGSPQALIDNVMGLINSPALAALLTSRMWADRKLGVSESPRLPNNTVWVFTGNNMRFGDDLVRRVIRINMFYADENPEEARPPFDIPDLKAYVRANRPDLLASLFTLARAWFVRGCPEAPGQKLLGSYVEWSRTIGGILHVAGIRGFLENTLDSKGQNDGDSQQWARLFNTTFSVFFDSTFEISTIVNVVREGLHGNDAKGTALHDALPEFILKKLTGAAGNLGHALGNAFGRIKDTIYGGLSIEQSGVNKTNKVALWRVQVHDESQLPEHTRSAYRLLKQVRPFGVDCHRISFSHILSGILYDPSRIERIAALNEFPTHPTPAHRETICQWLSLLDPARANELCDQILNAALTTEQRAPQANELEPATAAGSNRNPIGDAA